MESAWHDEFLLKSLSANFGEGFSAGFCGGFGVSDPDKTDDFFEFRVDAEEFVGFGVIGDVAGAPF